MKKKKRGKKLKKWFLLNGKKMWIIFLAFFIAVILHNLVYGLFKSYFDSHGGDEAFFFIIAVIIIPLYFLICFIYTIIKMIIDKSLFKPEFIIRFLLGIIIGVLVGWGLISTPFINSMGFYPLAVIFTFIGYYLVKLIKIK